MNTALERAVGIVGSQVELARRLGVRQSTLWGWIRRKRGQVPGEYCIAIEKVVAESPSSAGVETVTRYDLRPDIFGPKPAEAA